jgi:hypothetical protein
VAARFVEVCEFVGGGSAIWLVTLADLGTLMVSTHELTTFGRFRRAVLDWTDVELAPMADDDWVQTLDDALLPLREQRERQQSRTTHTRRETLHDAKAKPRRREHGRRG